MKNLLSRVLIIDDDNPSNFLNSMVVEEAGCAKETVVTTNGKKALDYLTKASHGDFPRPEIIFLDINMPVMDGWEFLEEYERLDKSQKGKVIVVMLSVALNKSDKEKMDALVYVNEFIDKPLETKHIHNIIEKYFTSEGVERVI